MLRRNVLIFHAGALGDFVLSWPLAMALGRLYPQSRVICVCAKEKGKLFEKALRLESVDVENGFGALFAEAAEPADNVRRLVAGAHTICTLASSPDSDWAKNVAALSADATTIFIDPVMPPESNQHASTHLLSQLSNTPVIATAVEQLLRSIAERGLGFPTDAAGPVVLHPGAGSAAKCWPLDRYKKLAEQIEASGRAVRWIAGEVEKERWSATDLEGFTFPSNLVELFDILRTASLFIGNDSGPTHLAGIIGIPTIALFGPTNPQQWKPLGPQVNVIARSSLDAILPQDVFELL